MICAGVPRRRGGAAAAPAAVAIARRRPGGVPPVAGAAGGGVDARGRHGAGGGVPGWWRAGRRCRAGVGVGTGGVPAAPAELHRLTSPGGADRRTRGTPPGVTPGVVGMTCVGRRPTAPAPVRRRRGAISGGGPPSPRFCCVPM